MDFDQQKTRQYVKKKNNKKATGTTCTMYYAWKKGVTAMGVNKIRHHLEIFFFEKCLKFYSEDYFTHTVALARLHCTYSHPYLSWPKYMALLPDYCECSLFTLSLKATSILWPNFLVNRVALLEGDYHTCIDFLPTSQLALLSVALACMETYAQENYVGPPIPENDIPFSLEEEEMKVKYRVFC